MLCKTAFRMRKAIFLVDARPAVGLGHFSRCVQLARALQRLAVPVRFHVTDPTFIRPCEFDVAPLDPMELGAAIPSGAIIVVDGYEFDPASIAALKEKSACLAVIDDLADHPVTCDILLNHNIYACQLDYSRYTCALPLLGETFALIRPEFATLASCPGDKGRVLVALGGGRLALEGIAVAKALSGSVRHVDVALGANPLPAELAFEVGGAHIAYHAHADLVPLVAQAETVVAGMGVTFLEVLASMRNVIGVQLVENQSLNADAAERLGYPVARGIDAVHIRHLFGACRTTSNNARLTVPDGQGAQRVARELVTFTRAALSAKRCGSSAEPFDHSVEATF